MDDTAKYVIHADITADGVVERSDVVGAVFGQTEGLLGDDLDLRDLQQSSKLGRIDVDIDSENGQSFGTITIASSLDKVETSILAAALETISRVGPCRATVSIAGIEDVRAAKRRTVVERAKELLSDSFDEDVMTSREILEEVRQSVRVEDIVEYEGLPAGPRVEDSDAIVVVEGRSDVLNLLRYGVKNALAVEGTNVPDAVAELTQDRTVTVFLDDDRGGDLIRKELSQVGDIDYVSFAPTGKSVEDLSRHEVMSALRSKRPFEEALLDEDSATGREDAERSDSREAADSVTPDSGGEEAGPAATDGSARPAPETETGPEGPNSPERPDTPSADTVVESKDEDRVGAETASDGLIEGDTEPKTIDDPEALAGKASAEETESPTDDTASEASADGPSEGSDETGAVTTADGATADSTTADGASADGASADEATADSMSTDEATPDSTSTDEATADEVEADSEPATLRGHVEAVVDGETGVARLLDESFAVLAEVAAENAFDAVEDADEVPYAVIVDGTADQRLLDVAAQRGVGQIIAADMGEYVKQPADVRIRTADRF